MTDSYDPHHAPNGKRYGQTGGTSSNANDKPDKVKTTRIKVLDTSYDEKRRLIKWLVRDLDPDAPRKEFTMAFLDEDLPRALGVNTRVSLPADFIVQYLEKIKGKEMNWLSKPLVDQLDASQFKEAEEDTLLKHHDGIDIFPFYEVYDQLREEASQQCQNNTQSSSDSSA